MRMKIPLDMMCDGELFFMCRDDPACFACKIKEGGLYWAGSGRIVEEATFNENLGNEVYIEVLEIKSDEPPKTLAYWKGKVQDTKDQLKHEPNRDNYSAWNKAIEKVDAIEKNLLERVGQ